MTARRPVPVTPATRTSPRRPGALWVLMGGDVVVAVVMQTFGQRLDEMSGLTAVATLGGHHVVVMLLAAGGAGLLAALAPFTDGFRTVNLWHGMLIAVACVASVVALAGMLSIAVAIVITLILVVPRRGAR